MNHRQKRLCRILLEHYDASGAQPCPLVHLSKKTGYDASDIYDKDSESGDLWPFDSRSRGPLSGMLSFSTGRNTTISFTPSGLVAVEKLCRDENADGEKAAAAPKPKPAPVVQQEKAPPSAPRPRTTPPQPPAPKTRTAPPQPPPAPAGPFSKDDIADARARFKQWLKSEEALKTMLGSLDGKELIEAAFDRFFAEFLRKTSRE